VDQLPPLAERRADGKPSPVVAWAGYDHLGQALALAQSYRRRKDRDTGTRGWVPPLLAGLDQLVPWLLQWHNEPSPAYDGERMGEYVRDMVLAGALSEQVLALSTVRAWRPPAPAAKPKRGTARRRVQ
jgi:hypothetical protein